MENHLGFLTSDIARLFRKRFDGLARENGVTGPQWRALLNIARFPGISQGTLAERLDVEPITTCRMIDRMELAGMVERRPNPEDRRAWCLYLTDSAKPLIASLQAYGESLGEIAVQTLDEGDRVTLQRLLSKVRENLARDLEVAKEAPEYG